MNRAAAATPLVVLDGDDVVRERRHRSHVGVGEQVDPIGADRRHRVAIEPAEPVRKRLDPRLGAAPLRRRDRATRPLVKVGPRILAAKVGDRDRPLAGDPTVTRAEQTRKLRPGCERRERRLDPACRSDERLRQRRERFGRRVAAWPRQPIHGPQGSIREAEHRDRRPRAGGELELGADMVSARREVFGAFVDRPGDGDRAHVVCTGTPKATVSIVVNVEHWRYHR